MASDRVPQDKKKAEAQGGVIVFVDEVVFQQAGTLLRTWALIGQGTKSKSESVRKSVKAYGALRVNPINPGFHFRFEEDYFNAEGFTDFVEQVMLHYALKGQFVHLILDGAGYHKKAVTEWPPEYAKYIEFHFLPPYSPDLNPTEWVWKKTKKEATHNRYFKTLQDLKDRVFRRFNRYQGNPASLRGIARAFA